MIKVIIRMLVEVPEMSKRMQELVEHIVLHLVHKQRNVVDHHNRIYRLLDAIRMVASLDHVEIVVTTTVVILDVEVVEIVTVMARGTVATTVEVVVVEDVEDVVDVEDVAHALEYNLLP